MVKRPLTINHAEMMYRPGEREAARAFFEMLDFSVMDFGPWLVVNVDPENGNGIDDVMYASEPIPAAQKFEDALEEAIRAHQQTQETLEHYREVRVAHPHYNFHFGVSIPTHEEWLERIEKCRTTIDDNPLLNGRVDISVFNPGDPGSVGPQYQAFLLTDILSTGTLQTGLILELQWTPTNDKGEIDWEELSGQSTAPDPQTLV